MSIPKWKIKKMMLPLLSVNSPFPLGLKWAFMIPIRLFGLAPTRGPMRLGEVNLLGTTLFWSNCSPILEGLSDDFGLIDGRWLSTFKFATGWGEFKFCLMSSSVTFLFPALIRAVLIELRFSAIIALYTGGWRCLLCTLRTCKQVS